MLLTQRCNASQHDVTNAVCIYSNSSYTSNVTPSKESIVKLYVNEKLSLRVVANQLGISYSGIQYWIKKYGIKPRTKSEAQLGCANHRFGLCGSLSSRHGVKHEKSALHKMSIAKLGLQNPMFGNPRLDLRVKFKGIGGPFYGKKHTKETLKKISGPNSANWKGGVTEFHNLIRQKPKYNQWRFDCLKRDKFLCVACKSHKDLQVDHIKQFALIISENKISNVQQADDCDELWNIDNGRTLCKICHLKTPTHGKKINV